MSIPLPGHLIAVWFSCGAASAVAAKKTLERYGETCRVRIVNNPIAEEHPDNRRFLADVSVWLGAPIEIAINPDWPTCSTEEVWRKTRYMAGVRGARCTLELKKQARRQWEEANLPDWHVLGFTAEEKRRSDNFILRERSNLLPVLVEAGISKPDCFRILKDAGIQLPYIYSLGYPNANCIGCVKATSPTYWNLVREKHPEVFARRAELSRELKVKLVEYKGKRITLDELHPNMKGGKLRGAHLECGVFCEEL